MVHIALNLQEKWLTEFRTSMLESQNEMRDMVDVAKSSFPPGSMPFASCRTFPPPALPWLGAHCLWRGHGLFWSKVVFLARNLDMWFMWLVSSLTMWITQSKFSSSCKEHSCPYLYYIRYVQLLCLLTFNITCPNSNILGKLPFLTCNFCCFEVPSVLS